MTPSPPAPRPPSVNGPVSRALLTLAGPSANVTSHLEAEVKGPSCIKGSRVCSRQQALKEYEGLGGRGPGRRGQKWEQLPWARDSRPPPRRAPNWAPFGRLFGKHRPRGPRWARTPTLFSKVSFCVDHLHLSSPKTPMSSPAGRSLTNRVASAKKDKETGANRLLSGFLHSPTPALRGCK